jgi:4-amino-4-deoxy-L-arabinose transferase-like glycosyltransferase
LLAIVVIAGAVRVAYLVTTGSSTGISTMGGEIAHNILAHGRWFERNEHANLAIGRAQYRLGHNLDPASIDYAGLDTGNSWYPEVTHPPGTGLLIAALWAISGDERYVQVQALQAAADVVAALLVYWIAMQLFGRRRVATIAALLYALYPPIAWQTLDMYDDIWAVDFTIAIVAIYLLAMRSPHRWRWFAICGLVTGVGAYFRPQLLIVAPVLALVMVTDTGRREALRRAATPTLIAVVLIVPWTVRNYYEFHTFIPIRSGIWETMIRGLNELPNSFAQGIEVESLRARPDLQAETPAWDAYLKHYFISAVEQHPLFYLEDIVHRVGLATVLGAGTQWLHRGSTGILSYNGGVLSLLVGHPLVALEYALEPAVFLLAMLGLVLTWRRFRKQNAILLAVVLAVLVPYIAIHVEARFLLPAVFVYFIWIALGVDLLLEHATRRRSAAVHTD